MRLRAALECLADSEIDGAAAEEVEKAMEAASEIEAKLKEVVEISASLDEAKYTETRLRERIKSLRGALERAENQEIVVTVKKTGCGSNKAPGLSLLCEWHAHLSVKHAR